MVMDVRGAELNLIGVQTQHPSLLCLTAPQNYKCSIISSFRRELKLFDAFYFSERV